MRDRRHFADRGDREADGLQRPQRRLAAGAGALHVDLEHAHAVLLRLAAGILGGHLRRIGSRLARALEALATGRRPGDGVALHVGRSEEHTSELQSLMRISYAVFCLKKKTYKSPHQT